jgi:translation initiation factor 4E
MWEDEANKNGGRW